jgi:Cysteine-rich secretory protein family
MRPLPLLLATLLGAGCTQGGLTPEVPGDGYGPAGGGYSSGSSSSSGGGSSTPPSSSTNPPSQPPPPSSDEAGTGGSSGSSGGGTGEAGSGWPGAEGGTYGEGGGYGYDGGVSEGGGNVASLLPLCVSQVNEFRNQNGEVPLAESSDLETYAAAAAAADASSGVRNGYFFDTNGGGVAATEDELDGAASFAPGTTAQQTLEQGLGNDEQANGQAAANLLDNQFSQIGCGFGQDLSGNWWVVIALR